MDADGSVLGASAANRPARMRWTDELRRLLMREYIRVRPFDSEYSESSGKWDEIATTLKEHHPELVSDKFDGRAASMHMCRMLKEQTKYNAQSARDSGKWVLRK